MSTAETAPAMLGPRYAPDDPTLPQPWKGLIDGNTGVLYYWNPETNVTQYEKPTSLPPPLPPGPPPAASTPTVASTPGTRIAQTIDVQSQQSQQQQMQQVNPHLQQQTQPMPLVAQQNSSQITTSSQQQGSLVGPAMQQQGQITPQHIRPQMMHYLGQQMPSQLGQMSMPSGSQVSQHGIQQIPQQLQQNQMYQGGPAGNLQGYHQFPHQQTQYMPYQQNMPPQGQQNSQQQTQQIIQGQQHPHQQDQKIGFPQREDADPQRGKQVGFSPASINKSSSSSLQNLSGGSNPVQASHLGVQPNQATQFGGSSVNMRQPTSLLSLKQSGMDLVQPQHGPSFPSQVGPGTTHTQQPKAPPFGPKMGYEGSPLGTTGNEYYYNSNKDGHGMPPAQPKLAAIPMPRNHQEMRRGDLSLQNVMPSLPGGLNTVAGPSFPDMYGPASGGPPFPNNPFMRPPPATMGPSDANAVHLSAAEIYRQTHEVTVTGDNIPAPFMTFEATGFPPEMLREVRYLLRRRSTCRTLQCLCYYLRNNYSEFLRLQNGQLEPSLAVS